jgi:hypothetical protein
VGEKNCEKKIAGCCVLGVGGGGVWIRRRPGEKEGVPFAFYNLGSATLHKHNSWLEIEPSKHESMKKTTHFEPPIPTQS